MLHDVKRLPIRCTSANYYAAIGRIRVFNFFEKDNCGKHGHL